MRPSALPAALAMFLASPPAMADAQPECAADQLQDRIPSSQGDGAMARAMDGLLALHRSRYPQAAAPLRWSHRSDATAAGTLIFELADMAPVARDFAPTEVAPYDHQFRGDMMKRPLMIRIGSVGGRPAWIAVNKRPDSPLPGRVHRFVELALSMEGQRAIANAPGFAALEPALIETERAKLRGFAAPLDPALAPYRPAPGLSGSIRSVGSDGMKALLDSWMCRFEILQPGMRRGARWEHFGTLNGFHALLVGETDIAPMGRELWPAELAQWRAAFAEGTGHPVEIAVARGGFNTPQRTSAQAIFVHPSNPLGSIRLDQLRAILRENPTITRWGQLGLTGEWADRPITIRIPPRIAPNAMSMQIKVLAGSAWNPAVVEAPIADTAKALTGDPAAIGFGGLEEGAPGLRALPVAGADGIAVPLDAVNASTGRYPLTRYMYIRRHPAGLHRRSLRFSATSSAAKARNGCATPAIFR